MLLLRMARWITLAKEYRTGCDLAHVQEQLNVYCKRFLINMTPSPAYDQESQMLHTVKLILLCTLEWSHCKKSIVQLLLLLDSFP